MNRELKFRIWCKTMQLWLCEDSQFLQMDGKRVHAASWSTIEFDLPNENYIIQQYTGLKDSKGVEIYEGDIVEIGDRKREVIFNIGMFYIDENYGDIVPVSEVDNIIEVIGNIFENPELIKNNE